MSIPATLNTAITQDVADRPDARASLADAPSSVWAVVTDEKIEAASAVATAAPT